ncbi:MAG: hypothetical protein AAF558_11000 [Verrucomicrobiota bacterium]
MKTTALILVFTLLVSPGIISAQEFQSTTPKRSGVIQEPSKSGRIDDVPTKHSTVVVMMSERGLEVISPTADPEMGIGERLVTEDLGTNEYDRKPYAGIRLFGWFF